MKKVLPSLALAMSAAANVPASAQTTTAPLPHQIIAPSLNAIRAADAASASQAASAPQADASAFQDTAAKILAAGMIASGLLTAGLIIRDRARSPA